MSYLRFRDEDESHLAGTVTSVLLGALAGFAVGMYVAQRVGGFSGLAERVRRRGAERTEDEGSPAVADDFAELDEFEEDEIEEESGTEGLEERVLEAFRNDPILCERAVDIGGIGDRTIELAGWVKTDAEAEHAVVLARGVPGVEAVLNRMAVGEEEDRVRDYARRYANGDDALTERHWEGRTVGTGRRRQGSSDDVDRHQTPRVDLAEKWTGSDVEVREAADDVLDTSRRARKPGRGVPKADHVDDPTSAM